MVNADVRNLLGTSCMEWLQLLSFALDIAAIGLIYLEFRMPKASEWLELALDELPDKITNYIRPIVFYSGSGILLGGLFLFVSGHDNTFAIFLWGSGFIWAGIDRLRKKSPWDGEPHIFLIYLMIAMWYTVPALFLAALNFTSRVITFGNKFFGKKTLTIVGFLLAFAGFGLEGIQFVGLIVGQDKRLPSSSGWFIRLEMAEDFARNILGLIWTF